MLLSLLLCMELQLQAYRGDEEHVSIQKQRMGLCRFVHPSISVNPDAFMPHFARENLAVDFRSAIRRVLVFAAPLRARVSHAFVVLTAMLVTEPRQTRVNYSPHRRLAVIMTFSAVIVLSSGILSTLNRYRPSRRATVFLFRYGALQRECIFSFMFVLCS